MRALDMFSSNVDSKQHLASSFGRAAESYDRSAHLQKLVGHALCDRFKSIFDSRGLARPSYFLDLGCGTGYFSQRLLEAFDPQTLVLGDISKDMLHCALERSKQWSVEQGVQARAHNYSILVCQLDAENLGFAESSIDLIFSSLALQWAGDLSGVMGHVRHCLREDGLIAFSTLLDGTLAELKSAWARVDDQQHVNEFLLFEDHLKAAEENGLTIEFAEQVDVVLPYDKPLQLMKDLKAIGAHNISSERPKALMGKSKLNGVLRAYEQYRRLDGTVPATYRVGYFVLRKPLDR